ncbi:hypothetical protein [Candidatus Albibeggiatoa sp. nov. NOAA]|uniref:hypothetical protein n=1 Tax=Candidatus Albibeggiatoa sp. nov. NOAA TaxID=3162724 RepID=UPI0032F38E06|nr:hypothetical protein [Thiotrichaceae bacterium]
MKNYVISTLVSLALASPFALADEAATPAPAVKMPELAAPELPEHIAKAQAEAKAKMEAAQAEAKARMEQVQAKREAHQTAMQAIVDKMKEAKTPEERQAVMQERMELMQTQYQEMQELMRPEMPTAQTAPMLPPQMSEEWMQAMQQRMEAAQKYREQMYSMNGYEGYPMPAQRYDYAPYAGNYYAPAPRYYDYPAMPAPQMMDRGGEHCKMKRGMKHDMMQRKMSHHEKMEQSMQNIEAAITEMLEIMKAK